MTRADIIVTLPDLGRFAEHAEGSKFTSSLAFYALRLCEQEDCSVVIVRDNGIEHERIDLQQMKDIARSVARIEAGLFHGAVLRRGAKRRATR